MKRELKQFPAPVDRKPGINAVGVIVDLEHFKHEDRFYELVDTLKLKPNGIKIMGYREFYDKNSPYSTPVFADKDLGWKGEIENSYALEFLNREYDLLINYFNQPRLMLYLMSIKTKAALRIGFPGVEPVYNDLILELPPAEFDTFKMEIKKYLDLLKLPS
ncbi:MAG: hypothetical protein P8X60_06470 [Robiginitalea sp.]